jgi:hypothetical protein
MQTRREEGVTEGGTRARDDGLPLARFFGVDGGGGMIYSNSVEVDDFKWIGQLIRIRHRRRHIRKVYA